MSTTPTVPRTHANQAQTNLDILNYVAAKPAASYTELFDQFKDDAGDNQVNAHRRFSTRLEHLLDKQKLTATGRGHGRTFTLGPDAVDHPASAASVARNQKAVAPLPSTYMEPWANLQAGQRATPPSINVMAADYPLYKAPPSPAVRPGALAYKDVASRGHLC